MKAWFDIVSQAEMQKMKGAIALLRLYFLRIYQHQSVTRHSVTKFEIDLSGCERTPVR
jgi:hypothetical protein